MKLLIKEKDSVKKRILGLDMIRVIAIMFVFTTHAITYRGVMDVNVLSLKWTIYMVIRFMAMAGVPLFLLLTGYLNSKKEISTKYYKGIIPILVSYIVISIAEIAVTAIYNNTSISVVSSIISVLNFSANTYAWYFEMYIGLFLLIPFLNILYENLKSKKEKYILVISLSFLTFLPQMVKTFQLNGAWLDITPDYWQIIYPITYFYIGKMIKEFQPHLSWTKRMFFLIAAITFPCLCCYWLSTETQYAWFTFNGFEALTNALTAIAIFLMIYDWQRGIPVIGKIVTEISICSFEMYLFSSIWDKYLYMKLPYNIFLMVGMITIITYLCSKIWITVRNLALKKMMGK